MHILITGASGFLGQYTVTATLEAGHQVRAISRRSFAAGCNYPGLSWVKADLSSPPEALLSLFTDIDAVIHLAAAMSGDFTTQYASTVTATQNLLGAMTLAEVTRLVAISSFSVYDYQRIPEGDVLDESSPLESAPTHRDIYTQMKLSQERLIQDFKSSGGQVTIIRPGMIYDADHLFNAFLGNCLLGEFWVRVGESAQLPIIYAEHCAEVIAKTISNSVAIGEIFNVVDDDLPDQITYAKIVSKTLTKPIKSLVIPWPLMSFMANRLWRLNQYLGSHLKLPGLLIPARLHARCKPLEYSNLKVKDILNWQPSHTLSSAIAAGSFREK